MVLISLDAALADDEPFDGDERPPRLLSSTTLGAASSSAALHAGARAPGASRSAARLSLSLRLRRSLGAARLTSTVRHGIDSLYIII